MLKNVDFTENDITSFIGKHAFLSNFHTTPFTIDDVYFPTVEHFFQACKARTISNFKFVAGAPNPREAKARGRHITIRENWENIRDLYMSIGLIYKFKNKELRKRLHETKSLNLYEGNNCNDQYWGYDLEKQKGHNKLGQLLMQLRDYDLLMIGDFGVIDYSYTTHIHQLI